MSGLSSPGYSGANSVFSYSTVPPVIPWAWSGSWGVTLRFTRVLDGSQACFYSISTPHVFSLTEHLGQSFRVNGLQNYQVRGVGEKGKGERKKMCKQMIGSGFLTQV